MRARSERRRRGLLVTVALGCGLASALSAQPGLGPLVLLVPFGLTLLLLQDHRLATWLAWAALAIGSAFGYTNIYQVGAWERLEPILLGVDAAVFIWALARLCRRLDAFSLAAGAAGVRVALELLWRLTPSGECHAWGVRMIDWLPLAQSMQLGGLQAMSALVVFAGVAAALALADVNRPGVARTAALALALFCVLTALGLGRVRLDNEPRIRVAAVGGAGATWTDLVTATEAAASQEAKVVVWSGRSIRLTAANRLAATERLAGLARQHRLWLVVGVLEADGSATGHGDTRSVLLFSPPEQEPAGVMQVPVEGQAADATRSYRDLLCRETPFGGLAVCRGDVLVSHSSSRRAAEEYATVLAVAASSQREDAGLRLAVARCRAIEADVGLIWADRMGTMAIITPHGEVVASTPPKRQPGQPLVADLPVGQGGWRLAVLRRAFPTLACLVALWALLRGPQPQVQGPYRQPHQPLRRELLRLRRS